MSIQVGDCIIQFKTDMTGLDAQLAKLQRAIQAMRDVLNEPDSKDEPVDFKSAHVDTHPDVLQKNSAGDWVAR